MVRFSYALVQLQQAYDEFEDNHMKVKFEHIVKYIKHIVRAADWVPESSVESMETITSEVEWSRFEEIVDMFK